MYVDHLFIIFVHPPGVPPTNSGLLFMPLKIKQIVRNAKSLTSRTPENTLQFGL